MVVVVVAAVAAAVLVLVHASAIQACARPTHLPHTLPRLELLWAGLTPVASGGLSWHVQGRKVGRGLAGIQVASPHSSNPFLVWT